MARYLVCMTGASGAIYGIRLIAALAASGATVHLAASSWGARVVLEETGRPLGYWVGRIRESGGPGGRGATVSAHGSEDFSAPIASGSFKLDGAAVVPCSMGTVGALAAGTVSNLVHRAGAVALKEGWPLVLVPRETPLSLVALEGLVKLRQAGAIILPACPGFYNHPQSIDELVDQIVYRVLDHLGRPSPEAPAWGSTRADE
jgi:4-hydroxy-3-polyprenylbenzoate decarboxylase